MARVSSLNVYHGGQAKTLATARCMDALGAPLPIMASHGPPAFLTDSCRIKRPPPNGGMARALLCLASFIACSGSLTLDWAVSTDAHPFGCDNAHACTIAFTITEVHDVVSRMCAPIPYCLICRPYGRRFMGCRRAIRSRLDSSLTSATEMRRLGRS